MGASQEKRKRQQLKGTESFAVKKSDEDALKAKKTRRNTIIVIVVVLVCLAAALFINSGYLRRSGTALKIGDSKISVAEYNYFYNNTYYDYRNTISTYYPDYADALLPSTSQPLSAQQYSDDMTWAEYIENLTMNRIVPYYQTYNAAKAAGYQLSDDGLASLDNQIISLASAATQTSFKGVDEYLTAYYGRGMDLDTYKKCAEITLTAGEYGEFYKDSLTYTADQLNAKKSEEGINYEQFRYRAFVISPEELDENDFANEDAYIAAQTAAYAAAKVQADAYCADIKSEEDFIAAAKDYDSASYGKEDSTYASVLGSSISEVLKDWLTDSARKPGDVGVVEDESSAYVVYFIEHDLNDYNTVDLRVIGISAETVNADDYAETADYEKAVADALDAAKATADEIYNEWQAQGATEEAFIQLANEKSDMKLVDGYANQLSKDSLFEAGRDWCFAPDRKTGDTVVLVSEDDNCAYIFWYAGEDQVYTDYLAEYDLRSADYNSWYSSLSKDVEAQKTWLFRLAG